jgi:hypothetical protein
MSLPAYKWQLKVGSASYVDVNPRWESTAKHATDGEQDEMWFRTKFSGNLTFQREDYDTIVAATFDTEFRLLLQEHDGTNWQSLSPVLRFWKTDCKFDVDGKTVEVTPGAFDNYDIILGGMDKEFNLIELEPPTTPVTYLNQGIFQVYLPGADFVANFTDGMHWELPTTPFSTTPAAGDVVDTVNHLAMLNDYGFGVYSPGGIYNYVFTLIPGIGDGLSPDVSGIYSHNAYGASGLPQLPATRLDGVYELVNDPSPPIGQTRQLIRRVSDGVTVYNSSYQSIPWSPFGDPPHATPNQTFTSTTSSDTVQAYQFIPYVRLLTTLTSVGGTPTIELPTDDAIPHGEFTHALPIETANFILSDGHSTAATRWGKFDDAALHFSGEYFTKPSNAETLMPVAPSTWKGASFWFYLDSTLRTTQQNAGKTITIEHAYKLSDVISTLLQAIGTTVTHQDGAAWSDFLYAAGTNTIRGSRKVPIITPKSNVLIGEYDQPATKAPIKLGEVLRLLRSFHNCFWNIASDNKFVIEHYQYYRNGGSYTAPVIGLDTTSSLEPKTGLPWGYMTSRYAFAKQDLPERIEFGWMDRSSQPFDGYAIDIDSAYVQKGNIEDKKVSLFTSDVDFLNVSPSDIVKEGFVFFEAEESGGDLTVPFVEFTLSADEEYKMQNGYAAFVWAHDKYHRYGLPASSVTLNKQSITASSVRRTKVQDVEIAVGADIDPYKLVTTKLGTGRIVKMEKNLQSKDYKITIRHDTE